MYIDKQTLLSDAQAITADAASTNIYDTGSAGDPGTGNRLECFLVVDEAFDALTSLDIYLETDDNSGFSSAKKLWRVNVLLAGLSLNAKIDLPPIPSGAERYLRYYYDVNGSNPTVGKVTSGFVLNDQKNVATTD